MVEHSAVNRVVVGSSPTRGVFFFLGSMVKRLRHRPFTAVTRVQIPLESFLAQQCAELKVIVFACNPGGSSAELNEVKLGAGPQVGLLCSVLKAPEGVSAELERSAVLLHIKMP